MVVLGRGNATEFFLVILLSFFSFLVKLIPPDGSKDARWDWRHLCYVELDERNVGIDIGGSIQNFCSLKLFPDDKSRTMLRLVRLLRCYMNRICYIRYWLPMETRLHSKKSPQCVFITMLKNDHLERSSRQIRRMTRPSIQFERKRASAQVHWEMQNATTLCALCLCTCTIFSEICSDSSFTEFAHPATPVGYYEALW